MYIFSPRMRFVSAFVVAYFLAGIAGAFILDNKEFVFYEMQMAVIMLLILYMDRRVQFTQLALWGLAVWGCLHLMGGLVHIPDHLVEPGEGNTNVLYNMRIVPWLPKYDQVVHAFGFGVSAIAAHESLSAHFGRRLPINLPIGVALFLIACGLGAVNELLEFAAVSVIPETNVGGYFNTGWDLVSNATGASAAIIYLKICRAA